MTDSNKKRRVIDWEAIEADYRAGIKTLREIAAEHGIAHGTITQKIKKCGWKRDLSHKIKRQAEALSSRLTSNLDLDDEQAVINANAQFIVSVDLEHRMGCEKARSIFNAMLDEMKGVDLDFQKRVMTLEKLIAAQDRLYSLERKILKLESQATNPPNTSLSVSFV